MPSESESEEEMEKEKEEEAEEEEEEVVGDASGIAITTPGMEKLFPVEILDRSFRRIERGYGELRHAVPPGLYVVRCDMGGPLAEQLVKVQEGRFTEVAFEREEVSRLASAAPVPGSESCHEYYAYPVIDASSRPRQTLGEGARLVLFASRLGGIAAGQPSLDEPVHFRGLELLDESLTPVVSVPGPEILTSDDVQHGRAAWSFELEPGGYLLSWAAEDLGAGYRALQPLWLARGWTTLVFANASRAGGLPDRRTVSIQMCRGEWDPYNNPGSTAAELALASLRLGRRQLADEHLQRLLHGKFDNPMLGLLGAHMLLERKQPSLALFREVLGNLRRLLGAHPDVAALHSLARRHFAEGLPPDSASVPKFPPMLRAGVTVAFDAEWDEGAPAHLGPLDSLARFQLSPDEPWTFFWQAAAVDTVPENEPVDRGGEATRTGRPIGEWMTGVFAPIVRPLVEKAMESLSHNLLSFMRSGDEESAIFTSVDKTVLDQRLRAFLQQLIKTKGIDAIRQLKPEHLRWTGLSPTRSAELIRQLQQLPE